MPNPVIMLIDDDQAVLNAVERDVRAKFGHDYRIVKANSGATALEFLKKLQQRNEAYRARFGFPFIICARLNDRAAIFAAQQARLGGRAAACPRRPGTRSCWRETRHSCRACMRERRPAVASGCSGNSRREQSAWP